MKRLFSIVLCAILICTVLIVPLSASAEENETIKGTWLINETVQPSYGITGYGSITSYIEINGVPYTEFTAFSIPSNTKGNLQFTLNNARVDIYSLTNNTIINNWSRLITFNTDTYTSYTGVDVTNDLLLWLKANAIKLVPCDGTTCPATDVNLDNICDDCGMTFSMVRDFTPNDFPSGYPSVPSVESNARYYMFTVYSSNITYLVVYPATVTPTYDTTKQNGYLYFAESYGTYRLDTTNNEWYLSSDDSPYIIGGTNNNSVNILYSSVPIKDQNGENFFPIPLWEKVEQVTQREIPLFSQTLGGNLMTLTLCGVGCLTLLVALVLLYKTLRTSLPR